MNIDDYTKLSDNDLKREIAVAIEPIPETIDGEIFSYWAHNIDVSIIGEGTDIHTETICKKCHRKNVDVYKPCTIPSPAIGSWADLADRLVGMNVLQSNMLSSQERLIDKGVNSDTVIITTIQWLILYIHSPARDRCCCILDLICKAHMKENRDDL